MEPVKKYKKYKKYNRERLSIMESSCTGSVIVCWHNYRRRPGAREESQKKGISGRRMGGDDGEPCRPTRQQAAASLNVVSIRWGTFSFFSDMGLHTLHSWNRGHFTHSTVALAVFLWWRRRTTIDVTCEFRGTCMRSSLSWYRLNP